MSEIEVVKSDIREILFSETSGVDCDVIHRDYFKPIYYFRFIKWPIVIPRLCIICGRPTSNSSMFVIKTLLGLTKSTQHTLEVMFPTCYIPSEENPTSYHERYLSNQDYLKKLCHHADASEKYHFEIITQKIDNSTFEPRQIHIAIPIRDWAETFAKANGVEADFDYQSVIFYLRRDRAEIPSEKSVSTIRANIKLLEKIFIECTETTHKIKKDIMKRFQQISLSFTQDELDQFQERGKRQMKIVRILTLLCLPLGIAGQYYLYWAEKSQIDLGFWKVILFLLFMFCNVGSVACAYSWFKLRKRTKHLRPDWEDIH